MKNQSDLTKDYYYYDCTCEKLSKFQVIIMEKFIMVPITLYIAPIKSWYSHIILRIYTDECVMNI